MDVELKHILESKSDDVVCYSVWVYDNGSSILQVYDEEMPNTSEVRFAFYAFNEIYWRMLESTCVQEYRSKNGDEATLYNFSKIKMFMLENMLASTNLPWIKVKYESEGKLSKETLNQVLNLHPRILRALFSKVRIFGKELDAEETKQLEKQCALLFGKGEGVNNPHEWIINYCNLTAFWEKFGLNYFDVLRLPHSLFVQLKKIMGLESTFRNQKMEEMANNAKAKSPSAKKRGPVRF